MSSPPGRQVNKRVRARELTAEYKIPPLAKQTTRLRRLAKAIRIDCLLHKWMFLPQAPSLSNGLWYSHTSSEKPRAAFGLPRRCLWGLPSGMVWNPIPVIPPRVGKALSTSPNAVPWGSIVDRRCLSLREVSTSNEVERWSIEAWSLRLTRCVRDFTHDFWFNFMKPRQTYIEVTTPSKIQSKFVPPSVRTRRERNNSIAGAGLMLIKCK